MLELNGEPFSISFARITLSHGKKLSVYDKILYIVLSHFCYAKKTEAWPGRELLAEIMGCSIAQISRSSKKLENFGLVKKTQRMDNTVLYELLPFNEKTKAEFPAFDIANVRNEIQCKKGANDTESLPLNTIVTTLVTESHTNKQNLISKINKLADANISIHDISNVKPMDYRKLDSKRRIHILARLFVDRCTNAEVRNGKQPIDYFRVRSFLKTKPNLELNYLYDFLYTLDKKKLMSMTEFYQAAISYRDAVNLKAKMYQGTEVEPYEEINVDSFLASLDSRT